MTTTQSSSHTHPERAAVRAGRRSAERRIETGPPAERRPRSVRGVVGYLSSRYALVAVWLALALVYLILTPDKFGDDRWVARADDALGGPSRLDGLFSSWGIVGGRPRTRAVLSPLSPRTGGLPTAH